MLLSSLLGLRLSQCPAGSSKHPSGGHAGHIGQSRDLGIPRLYPLLGPHAAPTASPCENQLFRPAPQPAIPSGLSSICPFILPGPLSSCHVTTWHLAWL